MADARGRAYQDKKIRRRRHDTRRPQSGNFIGPRMERLERRQLLAVLGESIVEGAATVEEVAALSVTDSESGYDSVLVQETSSFQEEIPAGLDGTIADDTASYFDALREYYDNASSEFGTNEDTDWSEVALSLEDQTNEIEVPDPFNSSDAFGSLSSSDSSSTSDVVRSVEDSSWVFANDPLGTNAQSLPGFEAITLSGLADELPESIDSAALPDTSQDVYVSLLDGPMQASEDGGGDSQASAGLSETAGAGQLSGVFASPQFGDAGGDQTSVSDTAFGIFRGIQNRWDAAQTDSESGIAVDSGSDTSLDGTESPSSAESQVDSNAAQTEEPSGETSNVSHALDASLDDSQTVGDTSTNGEAIGEGGGTSGLLDARSLPLPTLPDFSKLDPYYREPIVDVDPTNNASSNTTADPATAQAASFGSAPLWSHTDHWSSTVTFTDDFEGDCTALMERTTTTTTGRLPEWDFESIDVSYLVNTKCIYADGSTRITVQSGWSHNKIETFGAAPAITSADLIFNTRDAHIDTITQGWDETDADDGVSSGSTVTTRDGWIEKDYHYAPGFTVDADGNRIIASYSKSKAIRLDDTTTVESSGEYDRSVSVTSATDFDQGHFFVSTGDHVFVSSGESEYLAPDGTKTYYNTPMEMLADGFGRTGTSMKGAEHTSEMTSSGSAWNKYNYLISDESEYEYDRGVKGERVNDGSGWKDVPSRSWSSQGNSSKHAFKVWIDAGIEESTYAAPGDSYSKDTVYYEVWSSDEASTNTKRDVVYDSAGNETVTGTGGADGKSLGGTFVRVEGSYTYDFVETTPTGGKSTKDHQWSKYRVHDRDSYSSHYDVGTATTTDNTTGDVTTVGGGSGGSSVSGDSEAHFFGGATYDFAESEGSSTESVNTFASYDSKSLDNYTREDGYSIALLADGETKTTAFPPVAKTWGGSESRLDAWGKYAFDDVVGDLPLGDGETTHDQSYYFVHVDDISNYEFRYESPGASGSGGVVSVAHSHIDGKGESTFHAGGTYTYDYRKETKEIHDFIGIEVSDKATHEYDFTYRAEVYDDDSLSVSGGGYDDSSGEGKSKFQGLGSYDDSLETGDIASGGDGSRFAEKHSYDFEFTDEYEWSDKFRARASTVAGALIDERTGYLNSYSSKGESRSKVWGFAEETTQQDEDDTFARIDYDIWDESETKVNDLEFGTPVSLFFMQVEGNGTTFAKNTGGAKIHGHGHADHYDEDGDYSAGDGSEATSKNLWALQIDDEYEFLTNLSNERYDMMSGNGPWSLTRGTDFGLQTYEAKYKSTTDLTYDEKRNAGDYESHSKTTREIEDEDEYSLYYDFRHSIYTDTKQYSEGASMPVGKSVEFATSAGHDKTITDTNGKDFSATSWSNASSFDNSTYEATWESHDDSGSSYESEYQAVNVKLHFTETNTEKSNSESQSWRVGHSKYEMKDHHLYAYDDPISGSGGEETLHSTDESKHHYLSKNKQGYERQVDGTVTSSEESSTSDTSESTYGYNNSYTYWFRDPDGNVTTDTWTETDSFTEISAFHEGTSNTQTTPGNVESSDGNSQNLADPWSEIFRLGIGSPGRSSGGYWSPWRWMWTGDGRASDEMMNGALVAAGNSIKDNKARGALKVMATVDPTPLSGCVEATLSGVENGDSAARIAANCAIEAVPVPGMGQA